MSEIHQRIRKTSLHSKIRKAEEVIPLFKDGMNLGWSGFTPAGYPKAVPIALADHVEKNGLQGKMKLLEPPSESRRKTAGLPST